jgi:hypothetical protein
MEHTWNHKDKHRSSMASLHVAAVVMLIVVGAATGLGGSKLSSVATWRKWCTHDKAWNIFEITKINIAAAWKAYMCCCCSHVHSWSGYKKPRGGKVSSISAWHERCIDGAAGLEGRKVSTTSTWNKRCIDEIVMQVTFSKLQAYTLQGHREITCIWGSKFSSSMPYWS